MYNTLFEDRSSQLFGSAIFGGMRSVSLPPSVAASLDGWGVQMRSAAERSRRNFVSSHAVLGGVSPGPVFGGSLVVGTDCSGADAPAWALRALDIGVRDAFASDSWDVARRLVLSNSKPQVMFDDMCTRAAADVPSHNVYVCGFPCQPFSTLHNNTTYFRDARAAPFKSMLQTLNAKRPACAVLENVPGILRVRKALTRALRGLPGYRYHLVRLDPRQFGDPVRRPRVYMILVRIDVCIGAAKTDTTALLQAMLTAMQVPMKSSARNILLPNTHPLVVDALSKAEANRRRVRDARPGGVSPKWRALHARMRKPGSSASHVSPRASGMVSTARQRDAMQLLVSHGGPITAVDVSQSADRMPRTVDGTLPTQTPNSHTVVMELNRHVLPIEKLLIHGFLVHRMAFPAGLSESHLNRLGGNTMHVKCVAAALLLALGSVNWQSSASMAGGHPPVLPGKAEVVTELGSWPTAPRKRCGGGAAGKPNGKYHTVILSA